MTEYALLIPDLPGARTVLVVDDAAIVRRLAFRLLSEAGYRVFEAGGASEALEVVQMSRAKIELVLVDVVMPEVNGVDLARLIREASPTTAIVFMSAFPAEVLVREGLRNTQVRFLAKPFTREELLRSVADALTAGDRKPNGSPHARGRADA
jgi:two-component system cell cycle sensor histidine kinase/response regulator CckA